MKNVLITGSSAGIGKATAKLFATKGWQVAATMRKPDREKDLITFNNIKLYRLDVTDSEQAVFDVVNGILSDRGQIDVLVNNAGIGIFGAFEATSFELIQQQFDTNVFGLMRVTKAILPDFRKRRAGTIVNVSSGVGRFALPMQSLYNSAKFAIEGFSESLQYELSSLGIRVKIVEPGNIKTDFFKSLTVAETKELTDYQAYQKQVIGSLSQLDDRGSTPEMVAELIYRAANDPSPQLRYPAGKDVSLFLRLRKLLPDSLFFKIVRDRLEK
ncbi:MAG: SDR family oxidoreductase [Cyanosarcina radialis HA8281-LM2]|jgi:NAD(P)-dependent dehydrogenase (short-subunit alcohol dehydrogenase family)|nr:SDR family oxidoreductase [Cyanosarcina radialis HA8281-LM2]